jgi:hypothetical protein
MPGFGIAKDRAEIAWADQPWMLVALLPQSFCFTIHRSKAIETYRYHWGSPEALTHSSNIIFSTTLIKDGVAYYISFPQQLLYVDLYLWSGLQFITQKNTPFLNNLFICTPTNQLLMPSRHMSSNLCFSACCYSFCSFFEWKKEGISQVQANVYLGVFYDHIEYYTCVISIILLKSSILAGFDGNCLCASKIIRKQEHSEAQEDVFSWSLGHHSAFPAFLPSSPLWYRV